MKSFKRSWRILLLDLLAVLAPILAALVLYLLILLSEIWVNATADIPVGAFVMILYCEPNSHKENRACHHFLRESFMQIGSSSSRLIVSKPNLGKYLSAVIVRR